MKITSMVVAPMLAPYVCDMGAPYSSTDKMGGVAVLLRTDAGLVGENLLLAMGGRGMKVLVEMLHSLESIVVGLDPTTPGAFVEMARIEARHFGPHGVSLIGIGAIEGALLDLRAKAADLPAHRFLGATRERLPAYFSGALWPSVSLDNLQKTARRIVDAGYWGMKLRAGAGDLESQIARVKAVREAVGYGVKLLIDVNQRLDERRALKLGRALEAYDIYWYEEPVDGRDHAGEARISAALDTFVAAGESAFSFEECRAMVEAHCIDILMPDIQRVGGPREFLRIGEYAQAAGMPVSGHTFHETTLPLLACLPNACCLEVMPWSSLFYGASVQIENGDAIVSQKPGWGVSLDRAILRRHGLTDADV